MMYVTTSWYLAPRVPVVREGGWNDGDAKLGSGKKSYLGRMVDPREKRAALCCEEGATDKRWETQKSRAKMVIPPP